MSRNYKKAKNRGDSSESDEQMGSNIDKIKEVQMEIENSKQSVRTAIDNAIARGEKIEDLTDKADNLAEEAEVFHKNAKKIQRAMCWQYCKTRLLCLFIFIVIILLLYFLFLHPLIKKAKSN